MAPLPRIDSLVCKWSSYPLNLWLQRGKNTFKLVNTNIFENTSIEESSCEATLLIKQNEAPKETALAITNLVLEKAQDISQTEKRLDKDTFRLSDEGSIIIEKTVYLSGENSASVQRDVSLPINLPKWQWLTSDVIVDTEAIRKSLFKQYQYIHSLLAKKDESAVVALMNERLEETARGFYKPYSQIAKVTGVRDAMKDYEMTLFPVDPDFEFEIMGNGRLAKITRWDGSAQIVFVENDQSSALYFDFIFRKQANRWILTR